MGNETFDSTVDSTWFVLLRGPSRFFWTKRNDPQSRLCTKSNMPTLQYRERSDRMAHSTLRLNSDGWFVECATAALRSRDCTDRSTLTKIRVFVQSPRSHSNQVDSTLDSTWFVLLRGQSRFFWTKRNDPQSRLCTKSNMPTVQYRERSDRMAHSTLRLNSDGWFVECATAALRSRYCTDRSTLTKIRVFVQSPRSYTN